MALGTKNITLRDDSEGSKRKNLDVGNHKCTIFSIRLEEDRFKEDAYHLVLDLVGPEIENFEGFLIDIEDPSKGRHKGQSAKVKTKRWSYSDFTSKKGDFYSRDGNILEMIKKICVAINNDTWFDAQDNKHETIEDFVKAFNEDAPFKDIELYFCIGGKEYVNKSGYTAYDMFLPQKGTSFALDEASVMKFNKEEHIIKRKETPRADFDNSAQSNDLTDEVETDFSLD